jgi:hypothetical protein
VPRRNHEERRTTRSRDTEPVRRGRPGARNVDEEALSRRESGQTYNAIARGLELPRAMVAHEAFLRALGHRSGEDYQTLVANESRRLDELEERIRTRDAANPEKVARRLEGVDVLRKSLAETTPAEQPRPTPASSGPGVRRS